MSESPQSRIDQAHDHAGAPAGFNVGETAADLAQRTLTIVAELQHEHDAALKRVERAERERDEAREGKGNAMRDRDLACALLSKVDACLVMPVSLRDEIRAALAPAPYGPKGDDGHDRHDCRDWNKCDRHRVNPEAGAVPAAAGEPATQRPARIRLDARYFVEPLVRPVVRWEGDAPVIRASNGEEWRAMDGAWVPDVGENLTATVTAPAPDGVGAKATTKAEVSERCPSCEGTERDSPMGNGMLTCAHPWHDDNDARPATQAEIDAYAFRHARADCTTRADFYAALEQFRRGDAPIDSFILALDEYLGALLDARAKGVK